MTGTRAGRSLDPLGTAARVERATLSAATLPSRDRAAATAFLLLGAGSSANAADPPTVIPLPAGSACSFALDIAIFGDGRQLTKTFTDRDGRVRTITAGTGSSLTFTNAETGASLSTRSNGSVTRTHANVDGSETRILTGHNALILFPTDTPAGPSTTVHSGRVVLSVGADGSTFTVERVSGRQLDVCAALGG